MYQQGLVVEGGGMRGIYSCGVLDYFLDNDIHFDYYIAASAGAANVASFLAQQHSRNYRFYMFHTRDWRYMGFRNWMKNGSFFGLEHIYDTLTNYLDPIDYDHLLNEPSAIRVAATDAETGQAHYFENSDYGRNNCRILMASCALPAVCKPIDIGGRLYYDGGLADPIPVRRAIDEGCEKVVVVLSRPRGYQKPPESAKRAYRRILREHPSIIRALDERHLVYSDTLAYIDKLEREGRAVVIAPSAEIPVSVTTKDSIELERLYALGLADAKEWHMTTKDEIITALPREDLVSAGDKQERARMLYANQKISLGKAAELADLSKPDFIKYLGDNQISVFRYGSENYIHELQCDIENATVHTTESE